MTETNALKKPISSLKLVSEKLHTALSKAGIETVQDLLFQLPRQYEDRTHITPIANVQAGGQFQVQGQITQSKIFPSRGGRRLQYRLEDDTGALVVTLFRFFPNQVNHLKAGNTLRLYGEVRADYSGTGMIHPEYQLITPRNPNPPSDRLTPVYPLSEGITQKQMRSLTEQALGILQSDELVDWFADPQGPGLVESLQLLHWPTPDVALDELLQGTHPMQRKLALEELLAHRLALLQRKRQVQSLAAPPLKSAGKLNVQLQELLPFELTRAQKRAAEEVRADLSRDMPMQRLLQGDVGSGKTLVAMMAALQAIECGYQVALMAPTEILAEQHYNNIKEWMSHLNLQATWLTSSVKGKKRTAVLEALASGDSPLVVGTHALFQDQVSFKKLGLVIIDEQHRFGVEQRLRLHEKGHGSQESVHQFVLTATPIPRTLAMALYADLDVSVLDELPPGRKPVTTTALKMHQREKLIERIRNQCSQGVQCYWVCALIEESEAVPAAAAENSAAELQLAMPELCTALIHGQMPSREKTSIMNAFRAGEIDVLIATTVIEVGVDVPNATIMVIENAERFGLAQLHQLRGRVGRGSAKSYCILLHEDSLSNLGYQRLRVMCETSDGFKIAERDMQLRGPGELLGTRQKGMAEFRIANLARDMDLVEQARIRAETLLNERPDLTDRLIERWLGTAHRFGMV